MNTSRSVLLRIRLLVSSCLLFTASRAFVLTQNSRVASKLHAKGPFSVPAEELEANLSPEERTVVGVVRQSGPSVGFVTSVLPSSLSSSSTNSNSNNNRRSNNNNKGLPPGRSLGSGSCFVVDTRGGAVYFATNYHVIERAFQMQRMEEERNKVQKQLFGGANATNCPFQQRRRQRQRPLPPQVFVRINRATQYQPCRIVDTNPDLDLAVLCMNNNVTSSSAAAEITLPQPITFGSSSDLLVGQGLIAIGNPFALETSVSTGVVSALDREVTTRDGGSGLMMMTNTIRNCIQTDCAINPGNSGGPLFNRQGQVVGINTAILTTSGSSAGIGFAVPSDAVQPEIARMIRKDAKRAVSLGVAIWNRSTTVAATTASTTTTKDNTNDTTAAATTTRPSIVADNKNWIARVEPNSPADRAGMKALTLDDTTAQLVAGDAIVALNGRTLSTYNDLVQELDRCVPGEQLAVTLESCVNGGERRVVYLTLENTNNKAA